MPTDCDGPQLPEKPASEYAWTPKQRKMLHALRTRFWTEERYTEDRRAVFGHRFLDFQRWLIAQGYYDDDLRSEPTATPSGGER